MNLWVIEYFDTRIMAWVPSFDVFLTRRGAQQSRMRSYDRASARVVLYRPSGELDRTKSLRKAAKNAQLV